MWAPASITTRGRQPARRSKNSASRMPSKRWAGQRCTVWPDARGPREDPVATTSRGAKPDRAVRRGAPAAPRPGAPRPRGRHSGNRISQTGCEDQGRPAPCRCVRSRRSRHSRPSQVTSRTAGGAAGPIEGSRPRCSPRERRRAAAAAPEQSRDTSLLAVPSEAPCARSSGSPPPPFARRGRRHAPARCAARPPSVRQSSTPGARAAASTRGRGSVGAWSTVARAEGSGTGRRAYRLRPAPARKARWHQAEPRVSVAEIQWRELMPTPDHVRATIRAEVENSHSCAALRCPGAEAESRSSPPHGDSQARRGREIRTASPAWPRHQYSTRGDGVGRPHRSRLESGVAIARAVGSSVRPPIPPGPTVPPRPHHGW